MEKVNHNKRRRYYGAQDREQFLIEIRNLYLQGYSQNDISKILNIPRGTISRWMINNKIQCRSPRDAGKLKSKKYDYDENYFSVIDHPNKAYILGFILGDGCIYDEVKRKRFKIDIAEADAQILYDIASELNVRSLVKLRKANSSNVQNKVSLTLNCTNMCNDLIKYGIVPKKTQREKWVELENYKLQWAFIRGYFDADGHVSIVKYKSSNYLSPRIKITSSYDLLNSLLNFFREHHIALKVKSIYKKKGCYEISISRFSDLQLIYRFFIC